LITLYNAIAGSCAEQKANTVTVNPNLYNLASVKAIHETAGNNAVGINFNAGAANSAWMTGMQVIGTDMYISNRGNLNSFDSTHVLFSKLPISSTGNGAVVRQNPTGLNINSCDGFALDSTETKMIIADFHANKARSGTLSQSGSSLTITLNGSALSAGGGIRYARWNNDGSKYYFGYGQGNGKSRIKEYATGTNYVVTSGDTLLANVELNINIISDLIFNPDGTKMYLSQHTGYVHEYALSSAYEIGSGALTTTLDLTSFYGNEGTSPWRPSGNSGTTPWITGISWNDDGSKLYASSLWGMTKQSKVSGTVNPSTVTGEGGTRTNTMPVIEFRVQ
jgi:hypothetical protein